MLKISTEIYSIAKHVSERQAVEYVGKAGFDAWDFSMVTLWRKNSATGLWQVTDHPLTGPGHLRYARELKQIGLDNGIVCNQSHAPFPTVEPAMHTLLKRSIECTAEAGGSICVIHPGNHLTAEENAQFYEELLPFAREHGIKLAAENMFNREPGTRRIIPAACSSPEDFLKHLQLVNDPDLVACLDIGHAEIAGCETSAVELIHALGHHLQALHIQDNDHYNDSHQLPFTMEIDFAAVMQALKQIGYSGYLTLEANTYLNDRTPETVFTGVQKMAVVARRLAEMFENS